MSLIPSPSDSPRYGFDDCKTSDYPSILIDEEEVRLVFLANLLMPNPFQTVYPGYSPVEGKLKSPEHTLHVTTDSSTSVITNEFKFQLK